MALGFGPDLAHDLVPLAVGEPGGVVPGRDLPGEARVRPQMVAVRCEMQPLWIGAEAAVLVFELEDAPAGERALELELADAGVGALVATSATAGRPLLCAVIDARAGCPRAGHTSPAPAPGMTVSPSESPCSPSRPGRASGGRES